MPIDHVGLGVPDVDAALAYYDESMPQVGFQRAAIALDPTPPRGRGSSLGA
jgi:catechol 2,3-dioxygenase-like lactoylglutathione lyase family enzyme